MAKQIIIGFLLGILALVAFFAVTFKKATAPETETLPSRASERNGIEFLATVAEFDSKNPVKFEVTIDTHSGSLDFDLAEVSTLEDDKGNQYEPISWEGSAPGGHHRSGKLIFPRLESGAGYLTLSIKDDPSLEARVFEWDLKQ